MNNENFHPVLHIPPNTHALHRWDAAAGVLFYEYNGLNILAIAPEDGREPGFRHGSDGSMQSGQYLQQLYIAAEQPARAVVTVTLNAGASNLRPRRAGANEAILGQLGSPLLQGVNGLYDAAWDLLLDWHGCIWRWLDNSFTPLPGGLVQARFSIEYSRKAAFLNLRPHYYRKHLGYDTHKPWDFCPNPKPIAGWCSWEAYRRDISASKIAEIADFAAANLRDYGLEYIQVDDGYQKMPLPCRAEDAVWQGWLTCEEQKFPAGHPGIVESIKQRGLLPAIWTNANITNPDFPKFHPDAILWQGDTPLKGEWIDFVYSCTPECLATQVTPLFAKLRELGYTYVKIDAIRHLLFDGLHECVRLELMSDEDASARFRGYMDATRLGMGRDVYYLASWGELHEVIGVADACRISMDANPTWAGVRMQLFESARWYHAQHILFLCDPDHVCVRTNPEWAKAVLSLISLSGELYMLSDTPDAYTPQKLSIIRKTLPPLATKTAETGPLCADFPAYTWTKLHGFAVQSHETPVVAEEIALEEALDMAGDYPTMHADHPFSSLWAFHLTGAQGSWCVVERVATVPLRASKLSLQGLGLCAQKAYLVFDFWQQRFVGRVQGVLPCHALPLGHCEVLALWEEQTFPQVIASDRHVSMDAVSITGCTLANHRMELALSGVAGQSFQYFVHLPAGWKIAAVTGAQYRIQGEIATLLVDFAQTQATVVLAFDTNHL